MPHQKNCFSITAPCHLIATIALPALLTAQPLPAMGAEAKETAGGRETQSTATARSRGYVDDYAQLNALRKGVVSLSSGVQYEILQSGCGKRPHASDAVVVHYRAMLANGVEFDNTYERGEPASLQLDQYIVPGLKEALLLMKEGDEWRVTIPANMGFGGGRLLRKRDLIYEITLISVMSTPDGANARRETTVPTP